MGKDISILNLFSKLDCQASLNQLVEKSYKIALAYLRLNCKLVNRLFKESELTFVEAAISSITPLFCKESDEGMLPIVKEFHSWQPEIKTDDDATYFLNKVIAPKVEQYITRLLKEKDPFFAKILDSVNYLIKKGGFNKVNYFCKRYIVQSSVAEMDGKVIDEDSFELLPNSLFQYTKKCLNNILLS